MCRSLSPPISFHPVQQLKLLLMEIITDFHVFHIAISKLQKTSEISCGVVCSLFTVTSNSLSLCGTARNCLGKYFTHSPLFLASLLSLCGTARKWRVSISLILHCCFLIMKHQPSPHSTARQQGQSIQPHS